jgi:hypothetical protein
MDNSPKSSFTLFFFKDWIHFPGSTREIYNRKLFELKKKCEKENNKCEEYSERLECKHKRSAEQGKDRNT